METQLKDLLSKLSPIVGDVGIKLIEDRLTEISVGQKGWQKTALVLIADAVSKFGPGGVELATNALNTLLEGKAVKLDWADLATASDVLAQFQNMEADNKAAMKDYLVKIGQVAGIILASILKSLI